jgi:hypothetical protein
MFAPLNSSVQQVATKPASRSRRGTVLLLVLGALAMVLVLAVVYAALGRGDRRTASTVENRLSTIDNRDAYAQHIIDIVGGDVFDLVPEVAMEEALGVLGRTTPVMRRETVDLPYTDFHYISVPSVMGMGISDQTAIDSLRFRPSGGHSADVVWDRDFVSGEQSLKDLFNNDILIDPRVASDPWLASTRPVDLGDGATNLDGEVYLRQRDWLQISNFAPDGRFVNLFYLRADEDGFDAPSIDLTRDPNNVNRSRLWLLDDIGAPTQELPYESMLGNSFGGASADWNRPAHWTMYQQGLFRPINDPTFTPEQAAPSANNDQYFAYQYADADGDGFLDSRWMELVDFSDAGRPTSVLGESDYRFFMAARAIDLSSLANVTTATDFLTPPNSSARLGSGAHELNLFKLLNRAEGSMVPSNGEVIGYDQAFVTGSGQAGDYGSFSVAEMQKAGRKAYLRLLSSNIRGRGYDFGQVPGELDSGKVLSEDLEDYTPFATANERLNFANAIGSVYPGSSVGGNGRTSPYGIDDLIELLTFHGINDDRNFSLLEQTLSSDNDNDSPLSYSILRSDRSTSSDAWPATADIDTKLLRSAIDVRRMLTTVSGHRPLRSSILEAANYSSLSENVDRKIWLDNLVLGDGEYDNDLEGDSLADLNEETSELLANTFGVYMDLLAPNLAQEDWEQSDQDRFNTTRTQYYGHMGPELAVRLAGHMALNFRDLADMPYIDLNNGTIGGPRNGVPDVPTVTGLDMSDPATRAAYALRQDTPTAAVLRLSDGWVPPAVGSMPTDLMGQLWENGLKLDIEQHYRGAGYDINTDVEHVAFSGAQNVSHDAMIMYGIEPQPFLSQVSSMTMYTDVAKSFTDLHDGSSTSEGEWIPSAINSGAGPDLTTDTIDDWDGLPNINGDVDAANTDFLLQALFFQLFNPFDVPIVLDDYYIEYANSFFSVTDITGGPVVLAPMSTAVLWVTNPGDTAEITVRFGNANITPPRSIPGGPTAFERMLVEQLGTAVAIHQLNKRFTSASGSGPVGSGGFGAVAPNDVVDLFFDDPAVRSDVNRVAMLWRDNPDITDPITGRIDWNMPALASGDRSSDQLVDRMRDTSQERVSSGLVGSAAGFRAALDRRLRLPSLTAPNGEVTINDAIQGDDANRAAPDHLGPGDLAGGNNFNFPTQLGVALWGNISRREDGVFDSGRSSVDYFTDNLSTTATTGSPGNEVIDGTPIGALPAKVFEPTIQNPAGAYNPYARSPFLILEGSVAGDGSDFLPEGLDLTTDFAGTAEGDVDAQALWRNLQNGVVTPAIFTSLRTPVFNRDSAVTLSSEIDDSTVDDFKEYSGKSYISITLNQNEFRDFLTGNRNLRVGDMLLPLAVGAYRTPLEIGPSSEPATPTGEYSATPRVRLGQYEAQWTTLGEVLAAAAGYSDAVGPKTSRVGLGGVDDPFTDLSFELDPGATGSNIAKQDDYVLDRAHLRLDAFVPYLDMDAAAGMASVFNEDVDIRRGLGIPMALAIFDMAQAGSETGFVAKGGINRPVMGTLNANTADAEVLRLSPALAMDVFDSTAAGVDPFDRLWWPETLRQTNANDTAYRMNAFETRRLTGSGAPIRVRSADVGSTIVDYREAARTSRLENPSGLAGGSVASTEVTDTTLAYVDPTEEERGLRINRSASSGIDSIRSQPGIGSMGELFAARNVISVPSDPENPALNNPHLNNQHHMDGFARDNRTSGVGFIDRRAPQINTNYGRGMYDPKEPIDFVRNGVLSMEVASFGESLTGDLVSATYASRLLTDPTLEAIHLQDYFPGYIDTSTGVPLNSMLPIMPDQVPDDYDEQLVQLNAVLNSMSVGSDYYAVWFVLHGYRESDTQNLGAQDPLTPSFKGRYLMILDRSNVTEKGDQPRVLAFVQLPESLPPAP